jgi:DNA-binding transcriptional MocR family regulator
MESPAYPKHLRSARALYRRRRDAFVEELGRALPWANVRPPAAGLTLWLPLPPRISTQAAFDECAREGVLVLPADSSYPTRSGPAALRLSFGDLDEETAREGIARLARALARCSMPARSPGPN